MELDDDRILRIEKTDDNFTDLNFITPACLKNQHKSQSLLPLYQLLEEINKNVWGCDLMLCFFMAALQSYRADRCLRPFPQLYINQDGKNFTDLRNTCDNIPPLSDILKEPKKCSQNVSKLLTWLFLEKGHPSLKRISFNSVLFPSKFSQVYKPHFVFEVCYHEKVDIVWQKRQEGRETILAYHGSSVDNFYSILKVGLQQHFSLEREVLFGNGIYLSNELSVSAHYAPFGQTWANSALGNKHSVIAVCEIINDTVRVKCKDAKNKSRSVNKDSLGEIPEKYFVVTDSDMVRVKYLMVYRKKMFSVKSYITKHLFLYFLILYFILIVSIGIFNNHSSYLRFFKRFCQNFSFK